MPTYVDKELLVNQPFFTEIDDHGNVQLTDDALDAFYGFLEVNEIERRYAESYKSDEDYILRYSVPETEAEDFDDIQNLEDYYVDNQGFSTQVEDDYVSATMRIWGRTPDHWIGGWAVLTDENPTPTIDKGQIIGFDGLRHVVYRPNLTDRTSKVAVEVAPVFRTSGEGATGTSRGKNVRFVFQPAD